jgi:hypothetical protein
VKSNVRTKARPTFVARIMIARIIGGRKPRSCRVIAADGQALAEFRYPRLLSVEATGTAAGHNLHIFPKGRWRMAFEATLDGVPFATVTMGAWGVLRLHLFTRKDHAPAELTFTREGFFNWRYCLRVAKDLVLLEFVPRFNWRSFQPEYEVVQRGSGITPEQLPAVLALSAFCAGLKRRRSSG